MGSSTPLSEEAARALYERAEATAERSVTLGDPEVMSRATTICELHRLVSLQPGQWCRGLATVLARRRRTAAGPSASKLGGEARQRGEARDVVLLVAEQRVERRASA